jgi:uncharacterized membrane protein YkvA (DUF1232 family)
MGRLIIVVACVLYVISPIDFVPDIPVVGWGDDVVAALIGLKTMLSGKK